MGMFWAGLRFIRSGAFFGQALERGRGFQSNHQGSFLSSRLLFPAIIFATATITLGKAVFKGVTKTYHNHQDRKKQREHDQAMIEKAKIQYGQNNDNNQVNSNDETAQINPINPTNGNEAINSQPVNNNYSNDNGQVTILNPANENKPKSDNPFLNDGLLGNSRFDLEKDLKVMKIKPQDPTTDQYYVKVESVGSEPNFYVTATGIYNKHHQPYYQSNFSKDRTRYVAQLLELVNEHEYQDVLAMVDLFN